MTKQTRTLLATTLTVLLMSWWQALTAMADSCIKGGVIKYDVLTVEEGSQNITTVTEESKDYPINSICHSSAVAGYFHYYPWKLRLTSQQTGEHRDHTITSEAQCNRVLAPITQAYQHAMKDKHKCKAILWVRVKYSENPHVRQDDGIYLHSGDIMFDWEQNK